MSPSLPLRLCLFTLVCLIVYGNRAVAGPPEGRLAHYGKLRKWSDQAGKFQLDASMLEADENEVRLERKDGRVNIVPIDKLRKEDQEFVKEFLKAEAAEATLKEKFGKFKPIPAKKLSIDKMKKIEIDIFKPFWDAKTVKALKLADNDNASINIRIPTEAEHHQLIVAGAKPTSFLNLYKSSDYKSFSMLGKARLDDGVPTLLSESATPWRLVCVSPDGKRFIMINESGWRSGGKNIAIWDIGEIGVDPLFQFQPCADQDTVVDVGLLADDRIVTLSSNGCVAFWDLKRKKAESFCWIDSASSLHVGGRGELVAITCPGRIIFLDGRQPTQVGLIHLETLERPSIAFSPNGQYLAVYTPYAVDIYQLEDGTQKTSIPVQFDQPEVPLTWVGDYPMMDFHLLLDVERSIPLWRYRRSGDSGNAHSDFYMRIPGMSGRYDSKRIGEQATWGSQLFSLFRGEQPTIVSTTLPDNDATAAADALNMEAVVALPEGSEVMIKSNLQGVDSKEQEGFSILFEPRVVGVGWKIVDQSDNVMSLSIEAQPEVEAIVYSYKLEQERSNQSGFSVFPGFPTRSRATRIEEKIRYRPLSYTIKIDVDGATVYKRQTTRTLPSFGREENESAQAFADRVMQPNLMYFLAVPLPRKVLWPSYQWGLGSSTITEHGDLNRIESENPKPAPQRRRRPRNTE